MRQILMIDLVFRLTERYIVPLCTSTRESRDVFNVGWMAMGAEPTVVTGRTKRERDETSMDRKKKKQRGGGFRPKPRD